MKTLFYYLGVSALFTHELDAVLNQEWKLLFHFFELSQDVGDVLFVALHFPLFFLFFYLGHHKKSMIQTRFRVGVCIFLVVHSVLHLALSGHSHYFFSGLLSNLYIFSAAVFGLIFLMLNWKQQKTVP
ncbi:DUF6713 family protein [Candidatus Pelagadaptatus aseana]|uniref:DUF6713 family protein n=1 Tax=Candidatus Pelagadaptatus aseana TaxID=3120508 RepID=UPI003C6F9FAE